MPALGALGGFGFIESKPTCNAINYSRAFGEGTNIFDYLERKSIANIVEIKKQRSCNFFNSLRIILC